MAAKQVVFKTDNAGRLTGAIIVNGQFEKGLAGAAEVVSAVETIANEAKNAINGSLIFETTDGKI